MTITQQLLSKKHPEVAKYSLRCYSNSLDKSSIVDALEPITYYWEKGKTWKHYLGNNKKYPLNSEIDLLFKEALKDLSKIKK